MKKMQYPFAADQNESERQVIDKINEIIDFVNKVEERELSPLRQLTLKRKKK